MAAEEEELTFYVMDIDSSTDLSPTNGTMDSSANKSQQNVFYVYKPVLVHTLPSCLSLLTSPRFALKVHSGSERSAIGY
ncbi:hypothetical protein ACOMHN_065594 [Nucella lapillus]